MTRQKEDASAFLSDKSYDISELEHADRPLPWQARGLMYNASGYGRRIPTRTVVRFPGDTRWRRVYCCCFGNSGTAYVTTKAHGRIIIR